VEQQKKQTEQFEKALAAHQAGQYLKAFELMKPLAEKGDPEAQGFVGGMYMNGKGVSKDRTEAEKWFRRSAEQGNPAGQIFLGVLYQRSKDRTEAVRWFRRAAEQGLVSSQNFMGKYYKNGWGVPQDYVQAHKWYNLAASRSQGKVNLFHNQGLNRILMQENKDKHKHYVRDRDSLESKMTPSQVAEAQKLAREWKPKNMKRVVTIKRNFIERSVWIKKQD